MRRFIKWTGIGLAVIALGVAGLFAVAWGVTSKAMTRTYTVNDPPLQAAQGGEAPVLIRIDVRAGHGAGKPTAKILEQVADELAFLTRALRLE